MKIRRSDLAILVESLLFEKAQIYHPDGDMMGDSVMTKNIKFDWGAYKGKHSSETYMIMPGRSTLGDIQSMGDPFTYESEGTKVRVVSGPESLKKSIGKLINIDKDNIQPEPPGHPHPGDCPLEDPESFYQAARGKLDYFNTLFKAYRESYPGDADTLFFKSGLSRTAEKYQKSREAYAAAVDFEETFSKLTGMLDKSYSLVQRSETDHKFFTIKDGDSNSCKFVFIKTIYYVGICIFLHLGTDDKDFAQSRAQQLLNVGSVSRSAVHIIGNRSGINIRDFLKLVMHIHERGIKDKTSDEFFALAAEEDEQYFLTLSMYILSKV